MSAAKTVAHGKGRLVALLAGVLKREEANTPLDIARKRYRNLGWFLGAALCHLLWWDLLLNQPRLRWLRTAPHPRWQRLAARYCRLAAPIGGVPVKLGQFLSMRPDLLPAVVRETLAVLQDQAPPIEQAAIVAVIEADLAHPLPELFTWFAPQPVASASLAQVHLARLRAGELVAVKVLRPGVGEQIERDLAVIAFVIRRLKQIRQLRQQLDLDQVLAEFSRVLRRELDLRTEGRNAERFAHDFAADAQVYVPHIYWHYSSAHVLTLENVGYLRVTDTDALAAAGIQRTAVAQELANLYLKQLFVNYFMHVDLHPGNLFVKPLPGPEERRPGGFAPGEPVPYQPARPFQLVMIDFGMAIEIPEEARRWLHEFLIGLGLRDPQRVVQAYVTGNLLRPGVDRERITRMTAELLAHFQDALLGLMPDPAHPQARAFMAEYADLFEEYPFQIPMNLLFMYRGLNMMSGVVKQLDPAFDLSAAAAPFAMQLLWQRWQTEWQNWAQEVAILGRLLIATPSQPDRLLRQAQQIIKVATPLQQLLPSSPPPPAPTPSQSRVDHEYPPMQQLAKAVERLTWAITIVGVVLAGLLWQSNGGASHMLASLPESYRGFGFLFLAPPVFFGLRWLLFR